MTKKIETADDLAAISGTFAAELGMQNPKKTVEVSPKKTVEVSPKKTVEVSPKKTVEVSPKKTVEVSPKKRPVKNGFHHWSKGPYIPYQIDLEEIRNRKNPISNEIYAFDKKQTTARLKDVAKRCVDIRLTIERNDSIGYKIVLIHLGQEISQLQRRLAEFEISVDE